MLDTSLISLFVSLIDKDLANLYDSPAPLHAPTQSFSYQYSHIMQFNFSVR